MHIISCCHAVADQRYFVTMLHCIKCCLLYAVFSQEACKKKLPVIFFFKESRKCRIGESAVLSLGKNDHIRGNFNSQFMAFCTGNTHREVFTKLPGFIVRINNDPVILLFCIEQLLYSLRRFFYLMYLRMALCVCAIFTGEIFLRIYDNNALIVHTKKQRYITALTLTHSKPNRAANGSHYQECNKEVAGGFCLYRCFFDSRFHIIIIAEEVRQMVFNRAHRIQ